MQDTVRVDLKSDLNLGLTAGSRRNASELELAQQVVVLGHSALALKDLDRHSGLVVLVGSEGLTLLGGNDAVSRDELRHDTSNGLNSEGQGGDINDNNLPGFTSEDSTLNGGTVGDSLIRVDTLVQLLSVKEVLEQLLDLGDTSGSSNEDDLVNLLLGQTRVIHGLLEGLEGLLEQIRVEGLELGSSKLLAEIDSVEQLGDLNLDGVLLRQSSLANLNFLSELLKGSLVGADVLALLLLEDLDEVVHDALVEVLSSQMSVSVSRKDLKDAVVDSQNGDIESTTTKVKDQDVLFGTALVQTIRDGGGSGLVEHTDHV